MHIPPSSPKVVQRAVQAMRHYWYWLKFRYRMANSLLRLPGHNALVRLVHTSPKLATLVRIRPTLIYKYLGPYLSFNFSKPDRLRILHNHYTYLIEHAQPGFFDALLTKSPIWNDNRAGHRYSITMAYPAELDREGDLQIELVQNDISVCEVSFTVIPGQLVGSVLEQVIFIGRVQSTRDTDRLRAISRQFDEVIAPALLMAAIQGIAQAAGIAAIAGVTTDRQLSRSHQNNRSSYDQFWASMGGVRTGADVYWLPVPFPEKPIEQIKAHHRRRTLRKRQLKNQIRQQIQQTIQPLLQRLTATHEPVEPELIASSDR